MNFSGGLSSWTPPPWGNPSKHSTTSHFPHSLSPRNQNPRSFRSAQMCMELVRIFQEPSLSPSKSYPVNLPFPEKKVCEVLVFFSSTTSGDRFLVHAMNTQEKPRCSELFEKL